MRRSALPTGGTLAVLLLTGACGGVRVVDQAAPPGLAWPPGDPRVRLESVIEVRRGGGGLQSLLGGRSEERLFERPYGVAWDGGDLLVADAGARRVVRIDAEGRLTATREGAAGAPVGVAACSRGVVVSDSEGGRVALLGTDLKTVEWIAEGLRRPTGLACSGDDLFVVETGRHRLLVLGPGGGRRSLGQRGVEPGSFNFPTTVAVSGRGLLVGDALNFRIQRLGIESGAPEGTFGRLGDAPGEMPRIKGVAVDAAGQVWVSDAHTDRVSLYTAAGRLLLTLGGRGGEPGRFSFPAGIAAHPDGRVAVADSFNGRIQVFRLEAEAAPR